ncbi:peptidylprolyl isomerase [Mesobaculum littorinae]|uniref:Peptidylprolyl isomerase n=1 Tax=Mesobaculum littorinae TaxID=2486419 RepID=A0A438AL75_9RHOB|nr:peptidylprolyl isomerase [Mesobaculum littorinae]RVV99355.1 peptidylprolyl isomerase [Mesobaculum littorinae]
MARAKRSVSNMIVWVILLLLIIGLAGFGATNFGGSTSAIGRVGDTEITAQRYANALDRELRAIRAQTGQAMTLSDARAFGLDRVVLEQIVGLTALEDEADRLGLSVGDETLAEEISAIPAFQGLNGAFDREAYRYTLQQNGMSVTEFETRVREETARTILQDAVSGGIEAPRPFVDTLYEYAREARDFRWATVGPDTLTAPLPEPTEDELRAYYEGNETAYTLPQRRRITYAWVTPEMLVDDVDIPEDRLRALYDENIAQYVQPERRLVERLVFSDAQAAEDARAAIDAGETDFDTLVKDRGLTLDDVDLGDVAQEDLGAAGEAVFALDAPGIAGPAESPLGPALFRMNAILQATEVPFEEAEEDLRATYAMDTARRQITDEVERLDDLLAGGATLEDLAAETDMELGEILWSGQTAEGITAYDAFREAAAAAQEGDFPAIVELADGGVFALRLDGIVEPEVQPFEEVADRVRADWTEAQQRDRLLARAEEIAEAIRTGAPILSPAEAAPAEAAEAGDADVAPNGSQTDGPTIEETTAAGEAGQAELPTGDEATAGSENAGTEADAGATEAELPEAEGTDTVAAEDVSEDTPADSATDSGADATATPLVAALGADAVREETGILRDDTFQDAPEQLISTVFAMQPGDVETFATDTGAVIVILDAVNQPDPENDEAQAAKSNFARQAAQGYAQDLVDAYTQAIERREGVELNQSAINAVNSQFP